MKLLKPLFVVIPAGLLVSCSSLSSKEREKAAYEIGFCAGTANEAKRAYWANQNAILPPLPDEGVAQYKPIVVPEHTAPDGVIIEEHEVVATSSTNP